VVNCKRGACVQLDGSDDYVRVLDAAALKLTGDLTISAWIKPTSLGAKRSIVSKRYEFELGPTETSAPYALGWSHKTASGGAVTGRLTSSVEVNAWQHVVLVRNAATKQMRGYKNGVPGLTTSYVAGPAASTYNLNIGRNPAGSQHFKGLIDEVRIYDRALTDAEVSTLYSS
jgi:Concanavalin A-like lectin/glucanases superfamily